ncbi:thioredoxin-like protein [Fomitopsis serialis]|uniref:thioredoxin-like protein n=1 Tax=Fomitopsis serialis TaxID=139415 RepID=UPI002008C97C|nr:thioredoxin-like protein [Neoantrodia serialis]KAH9933418.1 thioredoxin-like protein [Neoantrodia serialis]
MSLNMFRSSLRSGLSSSLRTSAASPAFSSPRLALARRFLSDDARTKIQSAVKSTPVVLFMKGTPDAPMCGFSRAAIQVLGLHGVAPEKIKTFNVLEDQELRTGIKEFSDWPTIPQLYVDGEFVGGCDILLSMHQSGEFEDLLLKKGVIPPLLEEAQSATTSSSG